jgi:hypothetical protein
VRLNTLKRFGELSGALVHFFGRANVAALLSIPLHVTGKLFRRRDVGGRGQSH